MKKEQENMEKLLKSELKKEAAEILADVEAEESLKDVSIPEEMDDVLQEMIQKMESVKALEEMLPEKDQEALRLGREMQALGDTDDNGNDCKDENEDEDDSEPESVRTSGKVVVRYRRRLRKVYLLVAVVVIMVLAVGMTSIGGTPFVAKVLKDVIGDREMTKINTEREGEDERAIADNSEEIFYQKVEEEFGITPVKFGYVPEGTQFIGGDIDQTIKKVCMLYQYQETIIEYRIIFNYEERSYGYDIEDSMDKEEFVEVLGIPVSVRQYAIEGDKNEYVIQLEYENVFYVISAAMPKEEVLEIIQNLIFS